jgi:hypothetical protein
MPSPKPKSDFDPNPIGGVSQAPKLLDRLRVALEARRGQHEKDLALGIAHVPLPDALERKYPNAARELGWQFLFASRQLSRDPRPSPHSVARNGEEGQISGTCQ